MQTDYIVSDLLVELNLPEYNSTLSVLTFSEFLQLNDLKLMELGIKIRLHRLAILDFAKSLISSQLSYTDTETEFSDNHSQTVSEEFDYSMNSAVCISFKAISGLLEGFSFKIGEKGAKIGRSSTSEIVISDSFVSRKHCEVQYDMKIRQFFLYDTGSTTGTYVMVREDFQLDVGTLFALGQSEFKIVNIVYTLAGTPISLEMVKYEGPDPMPLIIMSEGFIGRSAKCTVTVPHDLLMSQEHAEIYKNKGRFYLRDLGSHNKTWIRLSPEGEFSEKYAMQEHDFIKVGSVIFKVEHAISSMIVKESFRCKLCSLREIALDFLPCGHKACLECGCKLKFCPLCSHKVQELYLHMRK